VLLALNRVLPQAVRDAPRAVITRRYLRRDVE
jgi:hypothetical protein